MHSKIRTGVIGIGSMGQNHVRVYSEISNLVAVSDLDKICGNATANKYGVDYYEDYKEMLKHVDAVTVSVPTSSHYKVCKEVIASGTHLLVEKPFTQTVSEGKTLISLAKKNKLILAVGHIERFNSGVIMAKEKLTNEKLGKIISISTKRVSKRPNRISDVGVTLDMLIHDLDLVRYLTESDPEIIFSIGNNTNSKGREDTAIVIMKLYSGANTVCEANWLTPRKIRKMDIITDSHFIELDHIKNIARISQSQIINEESQHLHDVQMRENVEIINYGKDEPLKLELQNFLESILGESELVCGGEEGLSAVSIAESVLKSMNQNVLFLSQREVKI